MGNCFGHSADSNNLNEGVSNVSNRNKIVSKGQQLKRDKLKWKSDIPLTTIHILNKRDEFWDTSPAFEGRREIWDALKAAAEAIEKNDFELAQAIIDGANIILPSGSLRDCYDELGNRYQLPLYVLSYPSNITSNSPNETYNVLPKKRLKCKSRLKTKSLKCPDTSSDLSKTLSPCGHRLGESHSKVNLNLRLSTGKDFKICVSTDQTIDSIKEQFALICGFPKYRQRWYCYGRLIENSNLLSECTIPDSFIVQVIVHNAGENNSDIMQA